MKNIILYSIGCGLMGIAISPHIIYYIIYSVGLALIIFNVEAGNAKIRKFFERKKND